jgi:hypothetical protein
MVLAQQAKNAVLSACGLLAEYTFHTLTDITEDLILQQISTPAQTDGSSKRRGPSFQSMLPSSLQFKRTTQSRQDRKFFLSSYVLSELTRRLLDPSHLLPLATLSLKNAQLLG